MHALQPNTEYQIVHVQLAMPASLDDAEVTDGLNEMFRAACTDDFIADWSFPSDTKRIFKTDDAPQEGDPFPA